MLPVRAAERLAAATDLRADAQNANAVLVLFSLPGCSYCEAVRAQHLLPLQRERGARLAIREVDMASDAPLLDFSGARLSQRDFARRHGARIAPTVMAFRAGGERAGEPIVGAKIPEFYGHYLEQLLAAALAPQGLR
jgi:thioredoxin-related protein